MDIAARQDSFYASVPVFRGFARLMDPALYIRLPDDWTVGIADVVQSTAAIAAKRYKAVNMAGAAVIASVTNALDQREFPFVFGGDGASFAVPPADLALAREAMAATAALGARRSRPEHACGAGAGRRDSRKRPRHSRCALRAVEGRVLCDVFRRRPCLGGSRDQTRRVRDCAGAAGHRAGSVGIVLPLRGDSVRARHHSVGAGHARSRCECRRISKRDRTVISLVEKSPDAGRPVTAKGSQFRWPPAGFELEVRAMQARAACSSVARS